MEWQQLIAHVGTELLDDGSFAYREIWVSVPRQSGKTTLTLVWEVDRALNFGKPQRIYYSAQSQAEAGKKLLLDQYPLLMGSALKHAVIRKYAAAGSQAITFKGESRIDTLANTADAGHGKIIDLGIIDEAFSDIDDRREQALIPAMATRRDAQILGISTMGTEFSVLLNRKVELGRAMVEQGAHAGIAYFEWCASPEEDIDDPMTWKSCMPALGHTITESVVRHARATMSEGDFRRAWLNQQTVSDERLIPLSLWEAANDYDYAAEGKLCFAVDATPERSAATITSSDGKVIELVEHREGINWVPDYMEKVYKAHGGTVALDPNGPGGGLATQLEQRRIPVVALGGRDLASAAGHFYDSVLDGTVKIRRHYRFDEAISGARKKITNDTWTWARRNTNVDISPVVAASLAFWLAKTTATPVKTWSMY